MRFLPLFIAAVLPLLWHPTASAQALAKTAENLQVMLRALEREVAANVPKEGGRGAILHDMEEARESLGKVKARALDRESRGELASKVSDARKNFDRAMDTLGEEGRRPSLRPYVFTARGQMGGVELELRNYSPNERIREPGFNPGPAPVVINRDERARNLATRYLVDRFHVAAGAIEIPRMTQSGNKYRVYTIMPVFGRYIVTLDAVGGTVFSAEVWR